jgi:hypothetical protein
MKRRNFPGLVSGRFQGNVPKTFVLFQMVAPVKEHCCGQQVAFEVMFGRASVNILLICFSGA